MILSDRDIKRRIRDEELVIEPIEDIDKQVQPASMDLYLGNKILVPNHEECGKTRPDYKMPSIRDGDKMWRWKESEIDFIEEGYMLDPGEFILGTTYEYFELSDDLVGKLDGRSSVARLGVSMHAAAGFGDPGFKGKFTLEIINHSHTPVVLHKGRRVIQVYFLELKSPPEKTYESKKGKYMDQDGPLHSLINSDWEE